MSYDFELMSTFEDGERYTIAGTEMNMTSNLARMWDTAGCPLYAFDCAPARALGVVAGQAIQRIHDDRATYEAMNPENGWGNVDSALRFLTHIKDQCAKWPDAIVSICR